MADLLNMDEVIHEEALTSSQRGSSQSMQRFTDQIRVQQRFPEPESRNSGISNLERSSKLRTSRVGSSLQLGGQDERPSEKISQYAEIGPTEHSYLTQDEIASLKQEVKHRAQQELEKFQLKMNKDKGSPPRDSFSPKLGLNLTGRKKSHNKKSSSPVLSNQKSQKLHPKKDYPELASNGYHSLAVSRSSGSKLTPQKLVSKDERGSQSPMAASQTQISLEKDLELQYRRKLAEAKHTIATTLREEIALKFSEETRMLESERAEVARLKAELNSKLKRLKEYKHELTSEFQRREDEYLQAIDSLENQLKSFKSQDRYSLGWRSADPEPGTGLPFDQIDKLTSQHVSPSAEEPSNKKKEESLGAYEMMTQEQAQKRQEDNFIRQYGKYFDHSPDARGPTELRPSVGWEEMEIPKTNTLQEMGKRIIEERLKRVHESGQRWDGVLKNSDKDLVSYDNPVSEQHQFGDEVLIDHVPSTQTNPLSVKQALSDSMRGGIGKQTKSLSGLEEHSKVKLSDRSFQGRTFAKEELGDVHPKTILELILEPFGWDDNKNLHMKQIRKQQMKNRTVEDVQLPRIEALIRVVHTNCYSLAEGVEGLYDTLSKLLEKLRSLWISTQWSCEDRMAVLERLEMCLDPEESLSLLKQEVNNLESLKQTYGSLYQLLDKRLKVRSQIETVAIELKEEISELLLFNRRTSGLYVLLRKVNSNLLGMLNQKNHRGRLISFPVLSEGSLAQDLVALDFWEEDYLHKLEGRLKAGVM